MLVWVFLFIVLRVKGQVKGNERSEPQEPSYLYRITHTFFFGIIRHPHVLTCFSLIQLSRNELDKSRSRPLQHFTLSFHPVAVPGLQLLISTLCPNSAMERGYLLSKISPSPHILLPSFGNGSLSAHGIPFVYHGSITVSDVLRNNITCTFSVTFLIPLNWKRFATLDLQLWRPWTLQQVRLERCEYSLHVLCYRRTRYAD